MNNEQQTPKGQSDFSQVGQYVQKFLPYWPLFIVSVALSLVVAYIKLRADQPMYVAYGKIKLKDPNKGTDSKVLDELNIVGEKKSVEDEIMVLRSTSLMQEVVKRLNLNVSVYNEGRVRVEELYKGNSPVRFIPLHRDSINGGGTYYFKVDWTKGEIEIDNQHVPLNGIVRIGETDYRVVPTPTYNKHVVGKNYFAVFNSVEGAANDLISGLGANAISNSSWVIDVNLTIAVPEKGKEVLSALFKVYNEFAIIDKNETANRTLDFIEDRLATVALDLDSVESKAVEFQSEHAISDLPAQAGAYWSKASEFEQQKSQIDLQLNLLNNIKSTILSGGTMPALGGLTDPSLTSALGAYQQAQTTLQQLETTEGNKSDLVVAAKDKVENQRKAVLDNIANVQRGLIATRSSYGNLMGLNMGRLRSNPQTAKAMATISRQQNVKNTIYNYLLEKREETQLNSASTIADMKVLESPSAYGPVSPVPKAFYTKWLLIGLAIPAGFVFIKDLFNRKVQMRSEIEQKTSVPIVAEISQINTDNPVVIREGKRTAVAEQFRVLRTNLTFMGLTDNSNTILVASSSSGEGKSFVAINLAISFTLIGKKVALLELDLRKPKVSKLLEVRNDVGISNYLVNQASINDIIKPTEFKDFFVLPSGIVPPNPAELLQKDRFRQLMAEAKERFDYVILDSAPLGPVADSFLLKDYADATVYIVRQNKTQRSYLKMIEEFNTKKKFKNLCIVFNGLRKRGLSYGGYGYNGYANGDGYYVNEDADGGIKVLGNRIKKFVGLKS
ncbi:polysaccharide biosynthesis tyrosine autokinase [Flavisolibacter ginsenosidimutans]|uniref:non-specific protein-tyrosine kinase n=1 Tax=Flavisolibacter ginsenosidimutans TaxID=661481 RepID=A0A5B8UFH3_9BACT|nr:tyrosine-protein kinase [Flavisolibacter ginsenosidimutans]QEC54850.1 polysaccharide biosynthesis tyrosine autokinase [Flavisolibacter ginsenosidimutans]